MSRPKSGNKINYNGECAEIYSSTGICALVDLDDLNKVAKHTWYYNKKTGYFESAKTDPLTKKRVHLYLHSVIKPPRTGLCIDHVSQDKLDCRKSNLRYVTYSENRLNSRPCSNTGYRYITVRPDGLFVLQRYVDKNYEYGGCAWNIEDLLPLQMEWDTELKELVGRINNEVD